MKATTRSDAVYLLSAVDRERFTKLPIKPATISGAAMK
jgi:hypothetical protein